MEAHALSSNLGHISSFGVGLNQTQHSALETSLIIAQANHKFTDIRFWGKINGIKEDYFIVYGINKDEINGRKFLYSINCVDWLLLQDPSEDSLSKSDVIRGRFIGDPSYEYEHVDVQRVGEGDDAHDEETVFTIKEEERLSAIVTRITNEFIVPRGALIKSPEGAVFKNYSYYGMNENDTAHLSNWLHLRGEMARPMPKVTDFADADPAIDFMDTIEPDIPAGVWSVQNERGLNVVLRNLKWLGLIAYAVPGSRAHGCAYFGTGEPNYDLPFML